MLSAVFPPSFCRVIPPVPGCVLPRTPVGNLMTFLSACVSLEKNWLEIQVIFYHYIPCVQSGGVVFMSLILSFTRDKIHVEL